MTRPALTPPSPAERRQLGYDHFATLAALLNERTFRHIRALGIRAGWHCWEAGAGGASVPTWLGERVGPTGHVLASDIDTSALEATKDPRYEVRRHDLTVDPPPAAEFDLVHARLVLEHLADARRMQRTLITWARPVVIAGGLASAEEIDQHLADLDSPDLDIAVFPIVSAWGRKQLDQPSKGTAHE